MEKTTNVPSVGEVLKIHLKNIGMTQKELGLRTGIDTTHIGRILNSKCQLTPEMAIKIEYALPTFSADKLLKIHNNYMLFLTRIRLGMPRKDSVLVSD